MNLLWYFFLYSFLGLALERVYAHLTGRDASLRRCRLLLPLCPVYGLGAVAILALPEFVLRSPALLFLAGGALATAVEYLCSFLYERLWGVRFWNYTGWPGCVHGRVCLPFSAAWGVLSWGLVYLLQPGVRALTEHLPVPALAALTALFLSDTAVTTLLLRRSPSVESLRWFPLPNLAEDTKSR